MANPLVPCPACDRHVRANEARCPFCDHALPRDLAARAVPGTTERLSRAAMLVFGATLAVAGCGGNDSGNAASMYGGPPVESSGGNTSGGTTTPPSSDADASAVNDPAQASDAEAPPAVAAMYGVAPAPMYGAAPVPPPTPVTTDAGPGPGAIVALYGAPMPPPGIADAGSSDAGRRPRRR